MIDLLTMSGSKAFNLCRTKLARAQVPILRVESSTGFAVRVSNNCCKALLSMRLALNLPSAAILPTAQMAWKKTQKKGVCIIRDTTGYINETQAC